MEKGQAALEFLTTYGFSFIIILSTLGGLFYFGVFDMSSYVTSSCDLGTSIFCPIFSIQKDDITHFRANLQLSNLGDKRVQITNMSIKDKAMDEYCFVKAITDTAGTPLFSGDLTLGSQQHQDFVFEFEDGSDCIYKNSFILTQRKRQYQVRLYFINFGATQETSISGTITDIAKEWTP